MDKVYLDTIDVPYYAVIFTSIRKDDDNLNYEKIAEEMENLAREQDEFLGVESTRDTSGFGITISYWKDLKGISRWKKNREHMHVQKLGRSKFYECYTTRIARVERYYSLK